MKPPRAHALIRATFVREIKSLVATFNFDWVKVKRCSVFVCAATRKDPAKRRIIITQMFRKRAKRYSRVIAAMFHPYSYVGPVSDGDSKTSRQLAM